MKHEQIERLERHMDNCALANCPHCPSLRWLLDRYDKLEAACEPFVRYVEYLKKRYRLSAWSDGPEITIEQQQALIDLFPPSEPELPDCVFCGGECFIDESESGYFLSCLSCNAEGPVNPTEAEAIAAYKVKGSK